MNQPVGTAGPATPQKNNTPIIIAVVALVLCCCCATLLFGWFYGDQILQQLNF